MATAGMETADGATSDVAMSGPWVGFLALAGDVFWLADGNLRLRWVAGNDGVEQPEHPHFPLGGAIDDLLGRTVGGEPHGELRAALASRTGFRDLVSKLGGPGADRSGARYRVSADPLRDDTGAFAGYRGLARMLRESAEPGIERQVERSRLYGALESMPNAFLVFDSNDRLLLWNGLAGTVFRRSVGGLRAGTAYGALMTKAFVSGDFMVKGSTVSERLGQAGDRFHDGQPLLLQSPGNMWWRLQARPMVDGGRALVIDNVSELKKREAYIVEANRAVTQANAAKAKFLAAASHDLRQPLHAFGLMLSALAARITEPKTAGIVQRMESALESLQTMFGALLDLSRLDAGVLQPEIADFPIRMLLDRIADDFVLVAEEKGLRLGVRDSALAVRSDPVLLDRILRNLVSNALRYTQSGGVLMGCRRQGDMLRIECWDTGIGIPDEKLSTIFEEFQRLDEAVRDSRTGLGLGLAIVQRFATLLSHPIVVRSRVGRGSMFAVVVPLADRQAC